MRAREKEMESPSERASELSDHVILVIYKKENKVEWQGKAGADNGLSVLRCEIRGASEIKLERSI